MNSTELLTSNSLAATATLLLGHAGTLVGVHGINTTAAAAFIQLFDAATAASVTVGTTVPTVVVTMATSSVVTEPMPGDGVEFHNGIVAASTTTNTGNTGATAHVRVMVR